MHLFSERYGYVKPSEIIIREDMPKDVQNAICNAIDSLKSDLSAFGSYVYYDINVELWCHFLNQKCSSYQGQDVATLFIGEGNRPWLQRMDLLDYFVQYLIQYQLNHNSNYKKICDGFVARLNAEFMRLRYGYRVVNGQICELTSEKEIGAIEEAIEDKNMGVQEHLQHALSLYAKRPKGDYRNSIKESISAVEAICRELTGESTLGKAIANLEKKGVLIQDQFKQGLQNLYNYTNNESTGIRHALMDESDGYKPSQDEAYFMLVTCSALVNYFRMKSR